jgi:hypothetical protein
MERISAPHRGNALAWKLCVGEEQIPMKSVVDREHIKAAADKAKGAIKDAAGKVTSDKELQSEGINKRKAKHTTP